jgi:8-hydroxy-5-deazaflavin:NADPH oxidoreductase
MKIAIIGSGNVGGALATGWSRSGHEILLGVRDTSAPDVKSLCERTHAVARSPREAASAGEVVVLALPWNAAEEAVSSLAAALAGKIVIDCMNPLVFRDGRLSLDLGFSTSGAETVARWAPQARVVKTLNQVGAEIMADVSGFSSPPVMLMAGNDPSAKATVARLLKDLGFDPLDAGDLSQARLLEPFGMVWINQAMRQGKGRDWAFAALSRKER